MMKMGIGIGIILSGNDEDIKKAYTFIKEHAEKHINALRERGGDGTIMIVMTE